MARQRIEDSGRSDAELITAVRAGDNASYEELYRRHVDGARAAARGLARDRAEADDLVSEAFARVLAVLQRGGGPEMAFRPYLVSAVRNVFYDRRRKDQRLDLADDVPEDFNRSLLAAAAADESPDREMVAKAFASLPERWQLVLWHTEVEGRSAAEVAPLLGLAPNAVAALGYRAREGLRQAYLNAHIQASTPEACRPTIDKLGAYVRDDISARDRRKVQEHLDQCDRCTAIVAELQEASTRLRGVLIPLIVGVPAAVYVGNLGGASVAALLGFRRRQQGSNPAPVAAAVAAAAVVVVGVVAFAATRLNDDGRGDEAAAPANSQAGPGGEGGEGGNGGDGGDGGEGPTDAPSDSAPDATATSATAPTVAPGATPPIDAGPFATNPSATSPSATNPSDPPGPTTPRPTTPGPGPTTAAPPAPTTPPTAPSTPSLSIAAGQPSPAIAGFSVVIPFTVTNAAGPASLGFGRSRHLPVGRAVPAAAPFVEVTAPPGATFAGPDAPAWTCTAGAPTTRCTLPALADGATTSVGMTYTLAGDIEGELRFTTAVGDGTSPPVAGSPVVVTVAAAPGVDELFVDRAAVTAIGNTVVTCAPRTPTDPVCPAARLGTATPPPANDKQNLLMVRFADGTVPDASTSSSSTLTLPPGATVLHALLVWTGALTPGPGGVPAVDPGATGTVRLVTPAGTTTVTADRTAVAGTAYRAAAEVSALVTAGGNGRYTVADVQVATGPGVFGSWGLLVTYRDPAAPRRVVALSTEFATVALNQPATLSLGGLPATAQPATITLVATEGDFGLTGERVTANGAVLSGPGNPADNVFNGSITVPTVRDPNYVNSFGLDIDRFGLTVTGPTLAFRAESPLDRSVLGPIVVAVDLAA